MRDFVKILGRVPLYKLFRTFGFPKILPMNITLSVTGKCNSQCSTCNIWKKKIDKPELSLDEIDKTFISLGKIPVWFTMSGGEPFLRADFVDICKFAYKRCSPKVINIPTNGIMHEIIPDKVEEIIRECSCTQIVVNLSIDEVGQRHDEIRGVKNNFEYAMKTYEKLRKIKANNFTLGIHTVISNFNVDRFKEIYNEFNKLSPDSYITEIAEERVELNTVGTGITPSLEKYSTAIDFLIGKIRKKNVDCPSMGTVSIFSKIQNSFRLLYYDNVKKVLSKKTQIIPCYAGFTSVQISPIGDVWFCCIKAESVGNLRDVNYDFSKIWYSKKADNMRKYIKEKRCFCPMANVSYTNMLCSFKSLFKIIYSFF